jgi:hypothetical protein
VAIALVQDRRAVTDGRRWRDFVADVQRQVAGCAEWVEVGHAINRAKWGVWSFDEYRALAEGARDAAAGWPGARLMGPAVIDFEYAFLMGVLRQLGRSVRFDALSHHLYVDRRGAPENRQGWLDAVDKFALARAVARHAPSCADRLIVSEVNWPLKGTGVYSPVNAPYDSPGPRPNDPSVGEDAYGDYMIRYLLLAICSGMVEQVYWWRLAARGFGLVDDMTPGAWRERPAYRMLKTFLECVGDSVFTQRCALTGTGGGCGTEGRAFVFVFRRPDGRRVGVAYAPEETCAVRLPFECVRRFDALGREAECPAAEIDLTGRPVYLWVKE